MFLYFLSYIHIIIIDYYYYNSLAIKYECKYRDVS